MACGGVDGGVRLLLREPGGIEFRPACKLSGHQDWVRCVAFRQPDASDPQGRPSSHPPAVACGSIIKAVTFGESAPGLPAI